MLAFVGEVVTDIASVPVPPEMLNKDDLNDTPCVDSMRDGPSMDGGAATTMVIIIVEVAEAVSEAVTVS
jgi:hypothetical protein